MGQQLTKAKQFFLKDSPSILVLNNDCLFRILSYLTIEELIVVEQVCERFAEVAHQVYNSRKVLDFMQWDHVLTIPDAMEISSRLGHSVHTLKAGASSFRKDDIYIPEFVHLYFKNLKKIHLRDFHYDNQSIRRLAVTFQGVTNAVLVNENMCNLTDENLMTLLNVNQLEELQMVGNPEIKGTFLSRLQHIRELSLNSCQEVVPQLFIRFCEEHPNLQSLNIFECNWIDRNCLLSIAENLKNLEKLHISDQYWYLPTRDCLILADLPNLKNLDIIGLCRDPLNANVELFLEKVSLHNRLETLSIQRKTITTQTENALRNLPNLKELNLHWLSVCNDSTLESLSCKIQRLVIPMSNVTPFALKLFIQKCSSLRFIDLLYSQNIDGTFIPQILEDIRDRSHMLELSVNEDKFCREDFQNCIGINPTKLMLTFNYVPKMSKARDPVPQIAQNYGFF